MFGILCQIDIQLETGEYFLSNKRKSAKIWQEKQEKQAEKTAENKRKREEAFIPPKVYINISFAIFSTIHINVSRPYCFFSFLHVVYNFNLHSLGACKPAGKI